MFRLKLKKKEDVDCFEIKDYYKGNDSFLDTTLKIKGHNINTKVGMYL